MLPDFSWFYFGRALNQIYFQPDYCSLSDFRYTQLGQVKLNENPHYFMYIQNFFCLTSLFCDCALSLALIQPIQKYMCVYVIENDSTDTEYPLT